MVLWSILKGRGMIQGFFSIWRGLILKSDSASVRCVITEHLWDIILRPLSYPAP